MGAGQWGVVALGCSMAQHVERNMSHRAALLAGHCNEGCHGVLRVVSVHVHSGTNSICAAGWQP